MKAEEQKDAERLRDGLPRILTEDSDRLNDLLGLNRRDRRFMASLAPSEVRAAVRARLRNRAAPEKPGEEERLLVQWHYGRPDWRTDAWRDALREPGSGPPSLLAIVLAEFVAAEREAAKKAGGRLESDRIADRAWTDTRKQLTRWDELEAAEREQCILRTFAVATLRDDVAILSDAAEFAPDLRDQFEDLLPEEKTDEKEGSASASPDAASDEWAAQARSLKDLLTRAEGPPPNPDLLAEIAPLVESLRGLEPAVRAELSDTALGEFLSSVRKKLDDVQADPAFWLDSARRASLEEMWEVFRGSLKQEAVGEVKRRFEAAVDEASDRVRATANDLAAAKERIRTHRDEEPADPFAQVDWGDALADLQEPERACRKRHRDAQAALLRALSPRREDPDLVDPGPKRRATTQPKRDTADPEGSPDQRAPEPPAPQTPSGSAVRRTRTKTKTEPPKPESQKPESPKPESRKPVVPTAAPKPRPSAPAAPAKAQPPKPSKPVARKPTGSRDPLAVKAEKAIIATLLEEPPRLGFAVQMARLFERVFPGDSPPCSGLLEAALLSDRLRLPRGAIAVRLRDVFGELLAHESDESEKGVAFQAAARLAACLRPALFAPNTGALSVLTSLPRSNVFPELYTLAQRVAGHAAQVQHAGVEFSLLRAMRTGASREVARERCLDEIRAWRQNAPQRRVLYQPATAVWLRWVQDRGEIGHLMKALEAQEADESEVRQAVIRWRDRSYLQTLVQNTDRDIRGSLRPRAGIQSRAYERLVKEAGRAADLAQGYLECTEPLPDASDFRIRVLSDLRRDLDRTAPDVLNELQSVGNHHPAWPAAGARIAGQAIERLRALLDPQESAEESDAEPHPEDLLASGFFTTRVVPDDHGDPVGEPREVLTDLMEKAPLSVPEVVRGHVDSAELHLVHRILEWVATENGDDVRSLRNDLEAARQRQGDALKTEIRLQRDRIESGLMLGIVSADAREWLDPKLFDHERKLADPRFRRLRDMRDELEDSRAELDRMEEEYLQSVRSDFERLSLAAKSPQAAAIKDAIERRDIVTANELIQQAGTNPDFELPGPPERDILSEFFPEGARAINTEIQNARGTADIVERIRRGKLFGDLPGARRDSAVRMLEAWIVLKEQRRLQAASGRLIGDLFSEVGFVVRQVAVTEKIPNVCEMETVPLENRDQSPVPVYGSGARGRYRVVCCWNRPAVQDLMQYTHQRGGGSPSIVLYFGRLSELQRRELTVACREREETMIVLDETALVFLCGERGSRLSAFFHCTLPFTHLMPYHTQGGIAPPEMFFGRAKETREVRNPHGSCFIYGGRQLGKTAILRAVEQREHRPSDSRFAFFVDLWAHDIGTNRPPADIWPLLWQLLRRADAIPPDIREPSTKSRGSIDGFLTALIQHFAPESGRTLLLLLDEADRFLEEDSSEQQSGAASAGYRESIRLKRLMDGTDRCIKVVFAGLHNVLRTAKRPNHPLGQFGRPIQVGPLLRNGEMREARDLLTRPLLAAGYRVPEDLVTRILAQTNYYPSLIQLYGEALINAMVAEPPTEALPHVVSERVLEAIYRGGGLRQFIRDRFQLTLNLDKRYEVIAYGIARLSIEDGAALVHGLSRDRIFAEAQDWWSEGFAETGGERFDSLLDEMDGLGVLRRLAPDTYALRNPNVLLLLGTKEQIEEKLLEERELPQEFKPRILRARRKLDDADDPHRSPLTFHQQDRLFAEEDGVVVLSGVPAAGLNDVLDTFGSHPDRPLVRLEGLPDREFFKSALRGSVKRQGEGLRVHALPWEDPWTVDWVQDALLYLKARRTSNRQVRVLFLADGDRLLALMREAGVPWFSRLERISLEPWRDGFVRQWMLDVGIADSADLRQRIHEMTGGWPALLMRLHDRSAYLGSAEAGLEELDTELSDKQEQQEWRRQFSLDDPVTRAVLRPLAHYGDVPRDWIVEEAAEEGVEADEVKLRLRWAHHLNLVRQGPTWTINPVVARLVRAEADG